mgnify:FL=1
MVLHRVMPLLVAVLSQSVAIEGAFAQNATVVTTQGVAPNMSVCVLGSSQDNCAILSGNTGSGIQL